MAKPNLAPFPVALISTSGTIEKTYNELHGVLTNDVSVLDVMLAGPSRGTQRWTHLMVSPQGLTRWDEVFSLHASSQ